MLSPIETVDACGCAGSPAALTALNDRAHNVASVRTMVGAFINDVCSPRGEQSTVMVQQFAGRDEALDARPRLARRCAQQCERRVAHLVAAVGAEGLLGGEAVMKCAGVVLPLRPGVKLVRVGAQALRRIMLRVDRNRHHVHAAVFRPELALKLRSEEHTSELQSRQYLVCRL